MRDFGYEQWFIAVEQVVASTPWGLEHMSHRAEDRQAAAAACGAVLALVDAAFVVDGPEAARRLEPHARCSTSLRQRLHAARQQANAKAVGEKT